VYYVSPQLWAWRPKRIEQVKKYVRKMLVIFPFEEKWYRERGVEAQFVGHPLGGVEREAPLAKPDERQLIALLPGSRRKEIRFNLPTMLDVAAKLGKRYRYILPIASTVEDTFLYDIVREKWGMGESPAEITVTRDARAALAEARAAVVASGTATVEAAVIGTPFVMVYRVSNLTYRLGKRMVKVPFYAMPNLIAEREVIPELVQQDFTTERVVSVLEKILPDGAARERMLEGLAEVRARLQGSEAAAQDASSQAAEAVLKAIAAKNGR
jgi:lipid-A-disaccharide synthase